MEGSSQEEVHSIKHTRSPVHPTKGKMRGHQPRKQVKCRFCGKTHEMTKESCPAWGKLCSNCNGRNNFAIVCQKKGRVHVVDAERQHDNAYILRIAERRDNCQQRQVGEGSIAFEATDICPNVYRQETHQISSGLRRLGQSNSCTSHRGCRSIATHQGTTDVGQIAEDPPR